MAKHITMEMWTGSFDKIASPGDSVDEEIAMHFLNCVPPLVYRAGYFQCSEPYSHIPDPENGGMLRGTYATFAMLDGGWHYLGNCFKGCREDKTDVPASVWG